ncbi:MAG: SBBP repeat-containing protein [Bacteroidota bacterium]|nr:SBBP repeat-containing protein [Bacteroidota bacterium]
MRFSFLLLASLFFSHLIVNAGKTTEKPFVYGFIENKGQFFDQNNKTNRDVLFLFSDPGFHVQLKQNGFSYEVFKPLNKSETTHSIHRIDISFTGSNATDTKTTVSGNKQSVFSIIPSEPGAGFINYYNDESLNKSQLHINHYHKIVYKNVYPQIDIEFLINTSGKPAKDVTDHSRFKYNFIIHPGGNINHIQLKIAGAFKTVLTEDGNILIKTAFGNILEKIPYSYQVNRSIQTKFMQTGENLFGLQANDFDTTKTLVIDPVPWATYFGGNNDDRANGVAINSLGEPVITGFTSSASGLATSGAYQSTYGGNIDVFVAKFNASGACLWATYFGGPDLENGIDISVDLNDNILITGYTLSATGIATMGAHQTTFGGGTTYGDAFIVKFNAAGTRLWGTYYGGDNDDYGNGIVCDKNGNIFLTGYTTSDYPVQSIATSGAFQTILSGGPDAIIAKFNASGVRQWGTYYGNVYPDYGCKIAIDSMENLAVSGITYCDSGMVTTAAFKTQYGGNGDAFLLKISQAGSRLWCTYFGGSGYDYGIDIAFDRSGNIFMTGSTNSDSGIAYSGGNQLIKSALGDAYLVKFNAAGSVLWSTYYGSKNEDGTFALTTDRENNILITGFTNSDSGMVTGLVHQNVFGGTHDAFLAKYNSAGNKLWSGYFGSGNADEGTGIACDSTGNIFVCGLTSSTDHIASPGAYHTIYGGGAYDAFLAAFTKNGGLLTIKNNTIGNSQQLCRGNTPDTLHGSTITGGYSSHQYMWLSSNSGINSGYSPAPAPNTIKDYIPTKSDTDTWYKRLVISGEFYDTSAAIKIKVNTQPETAFTINDSVQCLDENYFIFSDISIAHSQDARIWNLGTGANDTGSLLSQAKKYDSPGNYVVKLTRIANEGCMDSTFRIIAVNPNPFKPIITMLANNTLFSSPAHTYEWFYNNSLIYDSTRQYLIINKNGIYKVKTFGTNGCSNISDEFSATTVGLTQVMKEDDYIIYPNPATDILYIYAGRNAESINIEINNMKGSNLIKTTENILADEPVKIELSKLPEGIYILMINKKAFKLLKY